MKIASICRMLATRSHWVIHSVWLAVLAGIVGVNVALDYFQIQAADMRLLVSENNIAANVVKSEIASVTALLNAVEELVTEPEAPGPQEPSPQHIRPIDKSHVAEHLYALARSNPHVASIRMADSSGLIAASGSMDETSYGAIFTRTSEVEGREPLTVSLELVSSFWQQRMVAFNAGNAQTAVYTSTGRGLMPFGRMTVGEERALMGAIRGMDTDAVSLNTGSMQLGAESLHLVLRQVAAPFVAEGPLVVATAMPDTEAMIRWRGNMYVQILAWFAVAFLSTGVLLVEARSRERFEMSAEKMHESVQQRDKFISVLMEHAPIMVSYWDAQRKCRYANRMYRDWFGKSEEQIVGIDVQTLLSREQYDKCEALITATLMGEPQYFEQQRTKADGSVGYVLSRYIPDSDGLGVKGFFVIASDITELKLTQLQLEKRIEDLYVMATTDALTGIDNRRNLLEKVQLEIDRALRYGLTVAFLMMDIDHFKVVNDTYGHDAGDRVLQRVGALLHETVRAPDHVGRLGGEEFGILLTNVTPQLGAEIAEQMRRKVAALVVTYGDAEISFTVSIGVAGLLVDAENPLLDLIKRADTAMYDAKKGGRNCVRVAEDQQESALVAGSDVQTQLN
ncbi:MAG: GGDEF domain-containing protein [Deltaproteobacteria bacterium]|nr:GGDEF domain-containing protein [Deltaproteobacteria bacterium]